MAAERITSRAPGRAGAEARAEPGREGGTIASRKTKKKRKEKARAQRRRPSGGAARGPRFTASTADKYELYQRAVQAPEDDVPFLERLFRRLRGRPARHLREDFCGTGLLAATWIGRHPENTAEGVDNDPEPVDWGRAHNFAPLGDDASRMHFHIADVREKSLRRPDLRVAFNFSYCGLQSRAELLDYFRAARKDLPEDGLFVLDVHGGPEIYEEMEEERPVEGGFTYVWEQGPFYPATGEAKRAISFEFRDKTELKRIFTYDWRLWTLPELKDALEEAGFRQVDSYWEGEGDDGEGDGNFKKHPRGDNCPSWIAYLVAQP